MPFTAPEPQAAQFITGRHFDVAKYAPEKPSAASFFAHTGFSVLQPDGLNCAAFAEPAGGTGAQQQTERKNG